MNVRQSTVTKKGFKEEFLVLKIEVLVMKKGHIRVMISGSRDRQKTKESR